MNSIKKFSDNSQEIEISGSKKNPSLREIMKLEKKIGANEETLIARAYFTLIAKILSRLSIILKSH